MKLLHVASQDQVADIFTKSLPKVLLDKYKKMIPMIDGRSIYGVNERGKKKKKKKGRSY